MVFSVTEEFDKCGVAWDDRRKIKQRVKQQGGTTMFPTAQALMDRAASNGPLYNQLHGEWTKLVQEGTVITLDDFIADKRRECGLKVWEGELIRRRILGINRGQDIREEAGGPAIG